MNADTIIIRREGKEDAAAVYSLNSSVFGNAGEAVLIQQLHQNNAVVLSLVAADNSLILGHVLFSPVSIDPVIVPIPMVGLGPMAVLPSHQKKGIGTLLLNSGIKECRSLGYSAVVVLGHTGFYRKFGFVPAHSYGLKCDFDETGIHFFALELLPGSLYGVSGVIKYRLEFNSV